MSPPKRAEVGSLMYEWNGTKEIQVEVGIRRGFPHFQILGNVPQEAKEARDRIRLALDASHFDFPMETIIINVKPSHIQKKKVSLDLAMAVGILQATDQIKRPNRRIVYLGNLGLDGSLVGGKELLPFLWQKAEKKDQVYCLPDSLRNESLPDGEYYFLTDLQELESLSQKPPDVQKKTYTMENPVWEEVYLDPFQMNAFQGLLYALLGNHHSLLLGSPGVGKTMLHRLLEPLLPPKQTGEQSNLGIWRANGEFEVPTNKRPFRSPHHSTTEVGLLGGGLPYQPGEITRAEGGILFLDEALEFKDRILESLRMPMEDSYLEITRLNEVTKMKTDFTLFLSSNPCPCGNYQSQNHCHCSLQKIRLYLQKISGAFLDRITIFQTLFVSNVERNIRLEEEKLKQIVKERFDFKKNRINSNEETKKILQQLDISKETKHLSLRKKKQIVSLARTIADWNLSPRTKEVHIQEALDYSLGYQWIYSLG
ncbi:ATP-binding protein [Leptospira biflexa]|uniref:ATP-binding protein n=1 Tax=Leptospira biflexa TaxID=172 RepID=UPI0010917F66|nr:ATP-binding protein [Leptospira biflexa]TGM48498.1 ATP-binding protein [Leptospira biflexa]TGM49037.1 ATP-binding protein [Leptospira biflexa]